MNSTDKLLQATLNRIRARINENFINSATELALLVKEAPQKVKKEWELFQAEVIDEANKLETEGYQDTEKESTYKETNIEINNPKEKIDQLRIKVGELSKKFEAK